MARAGTAGTVMGCPQTADAFPPDAGERWMFTYSIEGDLRFISHHDTLRMFRRACARAALPVRYSEGFNPHVRLSIPLPRPVGVASGAEALIVAFQRPVNGREALRQLAGQMPPGIKMLAARYLAPRERPQPVLARYRLSVCGRNREDIESRARRILQSDRVEVERLHRSDGTARRVDVRPYLAELAVDGDEVVFALRVTDGGSAKPAEVAGLLGFDPRSVNHLIQRLEVQWRYSSNKTHATCDR